MAVAVLYAVMVAPTPSPAGSAHTPDAALAGLIDRARAGASEPGRCGRPDLDGLVRIFCAGRIRVGVRAHYPLFGTEQSGRRQGYEVDAARAIAARLGVDVAFVTVNPASRIPLLADGRIDLVIATMGHNTQRDGQVRFIRPHYYQSETALIGPRSLAIRKWDDVVRRSICVTVGNGSNAQIVSHGARLMLFDQAPTLLERLREGTCTLAAQDDSFFAFYFADPRFAAHYDQKLGFAQVPWGMAVALDGGDDLGDVFDLISQVFHRDGVFLDIARQNRIGTRFLERQQVVWRQPACNTDGGSRNPACVLPSFDAELQPTSFASRVTAFENWVQARTGIALELAMLKTRPAWSLFWAGVVNSLILVAGALAATLAFALLIGAMLVARPAPLRWAAQALTVALQSSPIVLTLVTVASIAHALFPYSSAVALGAAIVALGLTNGCNAGQAISEAVRTLQAENGLDAGNNAPAPGMMGLFGLAIGRSATQIVSFLINAAKGTPIASFVGTPELLNALTDITAFASGRVTTYALLLIFYIAVVGVVMWLCGRLRSYLERRLVAA